MSEHGVHGTKFMNENGKRNNSRRKLKLSSVEISVNLGRWSKGVHERSEKERKTRGLKSFPKWTDFLGDMSLILTLSLSPHFVNIVGCF